MRRGRNGFAGSVEFIGEGSAPRHAAIRARKKAGSGRIWPEPQVVRRLPRDGRAARSYVIWTRGGGPGPEAPMTTPDTLAQRFAAYATRLKFEHIPAAAVHEAKRR